MAVLLAGAAAASSQVAAREIYPAPEKASVQIAAGLRAAAAAHKNVLLDFGGNWCGDCQVLDIYFHDIGNRPILDANYVLVHVNVGHLDENEKIAERFQVPIKKGVPALVVLDEHGKPLYIQRSGDFNKMAHMNSSAVTNFLLEWKPAHPAK